MTHFAFRAETVITVADYKNLRAVWKMYGHTCLVKTFHCEAPLTAAQFRRIPKDLRRQLVIG